MEKSGHIIVLIVILGFGALLGPVLSSPSISDPSWASIPKSIIYIFVVWAILIFLSAYFIKKSKW